MNKNTLEKHKAQLEQWWGEAADSFPGEFSTWLANRIQEKIDENDDEDLQLDLAVYFLEINQKPRELNKITFRGDNIEFVEMIAQKHSLSTQGLRRLGQTDSRQTLAWLNSMINDKRADGVDVRLFASKKTGPVFAAYTNENLDIFGFCKVLYNGVPRMQTFGQKNVRLF